MFHPFLLKFPKGEVFSHCKILNAKGIKGTSSDKESICKVPAFFRAFCVSHPKFKIHGTILPEKMIKTVFLDNHFIKNSFSVVIGKPFTTFPQLNIEAFQTDKERFLHHFTGGAVGC